MSSFSSDLKINISNKNQSINIFNLNWIKDCFSDSKDTYKVKIASISDEFFKDILNSMQINYKIISKEEVNELEISANQSSQNKYIGLPVDESNKSRAPKYLYNDIKYYLYISKQDYIQKIEPIRKLYTLNLTDAKHIIKKELVILRQQFKQQFNIELENVLPKDLFNILKFVTSPIQIVSMQKFM